MGWASVLGSTSLPRDAHREASRSPPPAFPFRAEPPGSPVPIPAARPAAFPAKATSPPRAEATQPSFARLPVDPRSFVVTGVYPWRNGRNHRLSARGDSTRHAVQVLRSIPEEIRPIQAISSATALDKERRLTPPVRWADVGPSPQNTSEPQTECVV